jgi:hypothetical protein
MNPLTSGDGIQIWVEGVASAALLANATIADAVARILASFMFALLFIVDFEQ